MTTRTKNYIHPSVGGTRGFLLWLRRIAIRTYEATENIDVAANTGYCSTRTIARWVERIEPYRMTGGNERVNITGSDQLLLSISLFTYPKATADQICGFIHANEGDIYSREQVTNRCSDLQVTRKRGSKEAYGAFSASSIRKLDWFVNIPPPLGVSGLQSRQLIDIDETGFYLKCCAENYGRGQTSYRIRHPSHYKRNEPKLNVVMGIEPMNPDIDHALDGSRNRPRRWVMITQQSCDQ